MILADAWWPTFDSASFWTGWGIGMVGMLIVLVLWAWAVKR